MGIFNNKKKKAEAEKKATEEKARLEAERKAKEEAERKAKEEADAKAKAEAEAKAKAEAEAKAKAAKPAAPKAVKKGPTPARKTKAQLEEEAVNKARYAGKIIVYNDRENYRFVLKASNGELLCTSEKYSSKNGVVSAIETFKKNVQHDGFSVYEDKHGRFQYMLLAKNNRILMVGEIYASRKNCESAIESVKKFAANAEVSFVEEDIKSHYDIEEEAFNATDIKSESTGKYEVTSDPKTGESSYVLKASNGVLLFTSKTFGSKLTCMTNLESFKQLLDKGQFKIYRDKNKIYVFKIYTEKNVLMVVGEHYESLKRCQSALQSVIRFGRDAKVVEL